MTRTRIAELRKLSNTVFPMSTWVSMADALSEALDALERCSSTSQSFDAAEVIAYGAKVENERNQLRARMKWLEMTLSVYIGRSQLESGSSILDAPVAGDPHVMDFIRKEGPQV